MQTIKKIILSQEIEGYQNRQLSPSLTITYRFQNSSDKLLI